MQKIFIVLLLFTTFFIGCNDAARVVSREEQVAFSFETFREIPGVTEEEIAAVDALRERRESFVFGTLPSTEAFVTASGEMQGFVVALCDFLTRMFDITFAPKFFEWDDLIAGLADGRIDFTSELTPNVERKQIYFMTDPIALRIVKQYRLVGSLQSHMISPLRPVRYAFLDGVTTEADVLNVIDYPVEIWRVGGYEEAYALLKDGTVDAFFEENSAEHAFDEYGNVISEYFFPLTFAEVSLTTQNRELIPVINIIQKYLQNNGATFFGQLYNAEERQYKRHKLQTWLTDAEREYIRENPVINFLAEYDNYPTSFYNSREKAWQGIAFDVLNEITALVDISYKVVNAPGTKWNDLLNMLERGDGQMITELIKTQEREGRFLWSEFEHTMDYYALLSRADFRNINYNEILHMRVGAVRGIAYLDIFNLWFPNHQNLSVYENTFEVFDALERGEIDLVMSSQNQLLYLSHYLEHPGFKINLLFDAPFKSTFGFNLNDTTLASIIDKALAVTNIEGIADYWTRKTYDYRLKVVEERYPFMVGMLALACMVIALLVTIFIRNKKFEKRRIALAAEKEIAVRTSQSKSEFLATMSHEIRTPMNAIIGISQIQLQKNNLPHEYTTALNKIYNSGSALLGLINDILDMSKIETGKMELVPVVYDVASLINDTVQLNVVRLGSKQIKFIVDASEFLPLKLRGDELKLKQILNNLLSNAIKYTQQGYVKLSVAHTTHGEDLTLRFAVEDTGQGMKPEDVPKLFGGYLRFNASENRNVEGTGIGLSITKNLVELMDGTIEVESEYGKGSKFTVTVKQQAVPCRAIGKTLAEKLRTFTFIGERRFAEQQINRFQMPDGKVLVVDDVDTNLYVAEGLLEQYKLQTETVNSGYAAIDRIKNGCIYDVIFMDHMMPKMDGIETTKIIRSLAAGNGAYAHLKTVPIIALTANAVHGVRDMFLKNGFNDFLSKPIDMIELDMMLKRWMPKEKQLAVSEASDTKELINGDDDVIKNDVIQNDIMIDGVDVDIGVNRSGGTRETYLRMLSVFMSECNQTIDEIKNALDGDDMESYITRIHGFKSALSNIGAVGLSDLAEKLEDAGRRNDKVFVDDNTQKLFDEFENILRGIERVVSSEKQKSSSNNSNVDMSELSSILNDLLVAMYNLDAAAISDAAKRLSSFENVDKVSELLRFVMIGDYEEAENLAKKIIN